MAVIKITHIWNRQDRLTSSYFDGGRRMDKYTVGEKSRECKYATHSHPNIAVK